MSFIATAIVGSAIVGGIMSDRASSKAAKAAEKANDATLAYQERIAAQQRNDFAPFQQVGYDALPTYYRMLGIKPSLTEQEQAVLDDYAAWEKAKATPGLSPGGRIAGGLAGKIAGMREWRGDQAELDKVLAKQKMIADWDKTQAQAPELSPLAKWEMQQARQAQGRADSARGLSGSGGAATRETETESRIAGQDYLNSYARILDALKIGQGAAGQAGQASQQLSQQVGQAGANKQNIVLDRGQSEANFWQGLGSLPMDVASMGLRTPASSGYSPGAAASSRYLGGSAGLLI